MGRGDCLGWGFVRCASERGDHSNTAHGGGRERTVVAPRVGQRDARDGAHAQQLLVSATSSSCRCCRCPLLLLWLACVSERPVVSVVYSTHRFILPTPIRSPFLHTHLPTWRGTSASMGSTTKCSSTRVHMRCCTASLACFVRRMLSVCGLCVDRFVGHVFKFEK